MRTWLSSYRNPVNTHGSQRGNRKLPLADRYPCGKPHRQELLIDAENSR